MEATSDVAHDHIALRDIVIASFSISANVTIKACGSDFRLTTVYGPSRREHKHAFLNHLRSLRPSDSAKWLIVGDFNLIYKAKDKNNRRLNLQLMRRFRSALAFCELKEIHLQNRKFTWSNERRWPTQSRIDRFFCNEAWDIAFDDHTLHALSSNHSDHCPLLLARSSGPRRPRPFKFENFWLKLPRFHETVQQAWNQPSHHTEPFHRLGHKLHVTAKALRSWSASITSDAKLKFFMAQTVFHLFDLLQEARPLSDAEFNIRSKLKRRLLGWAVLERARKRQCSRVRNLREGDANTRFFHLKANGRRRKNFI
jgi:hypothetical protein